MKSKLSAGGRWRCENVAGGGHGRARFATTAPSWGTLTRVRERPQGTRWAAGGPYYAHPDHDAVGPASRRRGGDAADGARRRAARAATSWSWCSSSRGRGRPSCAKPAFASRCSRRGACATLHRWAATVVRLARIFRRRQPDLILNWSAKTQLYGAPAAVLAGMSDRVVWWQHAIPGAPLDRPLRDRAAGDRDRLLLGDGRPRAGAPVSPVAADVRRRPRRAVARRCARPAGAARAARRTCRSSASSGACSRGRARIACSAPRRCCASAGTASTR